ncbi:MAG: GC-type dockerin domain-anchored protein [Phycisphaerales bacterium]
MPMLSLRASLPALAALLIPSTFCAAQPPQWPLERTGGPDLIVGTVFDARVYEPQVRNSEAWRAVAIGTDAWNIGDRPVDWDTTTSHHAVIVQGLYRGSGLRFEQLGMSWAKHVVVAANLPSDPSYGPCINPGDFAHLGVNCADLYSSAQNGAQGGLGPRYDVNPTTGAFTTPYASLAPPVQSGDALARRVAARESDLLTASNPEAAYYAETAIYSPDDAGWGNGRNNTSVRLLSPFNSLPTTAQGVGFAGPSYRTTALEYWAWATPGVVATSAEIHERDAVVVDRWVPYAPGDSTAVARPQSQWTSVTRHLRTRFVAAGSATDNGDGTWTYRYAVQNVNSHRAGSAFSVHVPAGGAVTGMVFHAPLYHSGDRVRNVPWASQVAGGRLTWRMDDATEQVTLPTVGTVTFEPNALRFATVYSFEARIAAPPRSGTAHLSLWRPPADGAGFQSNELALTGLPVPRSCAADLGGPGGASTPDGRLDNNDFIAFIGAYFVGDLNDADLGMHGGVSVPDNRLDNNDFIAFVGAFFDGCE